VTTVVLDASVAAKWFLPLADETLLQEALDLLGRYTKGEVRFIVPDLFWPEFGNILWKAMRQGRCSRGSAESALADLLNRKLPTFQSLELLDHAFAIAAQFDRTVNDGVYVALAIAKKAHVVTADERLANALAAYLPVNCLGAF
jgi:predicted nucleic acid-binding protein